MFVVRYSLSIYMLTLTTLIDQILFTFYTVHIKGMPYSGQSNQQIICFGFLPDFSSTLSNTHVGPSFCWLVGHQHKDFHSGRSQSIRRPWDVIYFHASSELCEFIGFLPDLFWIYSCTYEASAIFWCWP